jgi:hypothetical protein
MTVERGCLPYHHWEEHTQIYFKRGWVRVWSWLLFRRPARARVELHEGGAHHGGAS